MDIGKLLKKAGEIFQKEWSKTLLMYISFLIVMIIPVMISAFLGLESPVVLVTLIILISIFVIPLQSGFMKQLILIYKNENVEILDFVKYGLKNFGKSLRITFRLLGKYIPIILLMICSIITMGFSVADMSISAINIILLLIGFVGIMITYVYLFILSLKYMFVYNELAYDDNRSSNQIINTVEENMIGNKGNLFVYLIIYNSVISVCTSYFGSSSSVLGIMIALLLDLVIMSYFQYVFIAFYDEVRNDKMSVKTEIFENNDDGNSPIN